MGIEHIIKINNNDVNTVVAEVEIKDGKIRISKTKEFKQGERIDTYQ